MVYKAFVDALSVDPKRVCCVEDIPCMPVEFFKTHMVKSGDWDHGKCVQKFRDFSNCPTLSTSLDDSGLGMVQPTSHDGVGRRNGTGLWTPGLGWGCCRVTSEGKTPPCCTWKSDFMTLADGMTKAC